MGVKFENRPNKSVYVTLGNEKAPEVSPEGPAPLSRNATRRSGRDPSQWQ
jgi:hypothetical protein